MNKTLEQIITEIAESVYFKSDKIFYDNHNKFCGDNCLCKECFIKKTCSNIREAVYQEIIEKIKCERIH